MTLRTDIIARRINRREERAVRKTAIPAGACSTCWAPPKNWLLSKRSTKDGLHCRECGAFRSDWVNPKYALPTESELARRKAIASDYVNGNAASLDEFTCRPTRISGNGKGTDS